jgi:hypothetical protein
MAWTELHTEGLQWMLEICFSEEQSPLGAAAFYIGLCTNTSLAENATLTSVTEVEGTGYERQPVASSNAGWTSATTGTNDRKQTSATVTFTAGGTWTGATGVFLCTVSTGTAGKLIASVNLSTTRTLIINDTLTVAVEIDLTG